MTDFFDRLRRLLGLGPSPEPQPVPPGAPPRREIEERLANSSVPGAALAKVEGGELAWVAGYGRARRGHFVQGRTVFQAASVSKPVTALAVLALAEAGQLDLDGDVRDRLTLDIPVHPVLDHQPGTVGAVTARLLLQHRGGIVGRGTTPAPGGGFRDSTVGGGSLRLIQRPGVRVPSLEDSWHGRDGATGVALTYPPGTRTSYSGAGYLVLQRLIEDVTGSSYRDHLHALFDRLGVSSGSFELRPPPDLPFARGHDSRGKELPGGHELVPWSAAGGLFANATGLAEILMAMLPGGDGPVSDDLLAEMVRRSMGVFGRTEDGQRVFRHGGDNGGYRAIIVGRPATRSGAVVLTNGRAADGTTLRLELAERIG